METFHDPKIAPGQRQTWYPWPYVEGLTIAEATNELAFMVTGAYGKPVPKQMGAPIRLAVPWKYGFKSIKSIVRFNFTDQRPKGYWESLQGGEYGFWANVNPEVVASALEPGDRGGDRHQRAPPDAAVQRLWRVCRRPLQGPREGAALGVTQSLMLAHAPPCPAQAETRYSDPKRPGCPLARDRSIRARSLERRRRATASRRAGSADWSSSRSPWRWRSSGPIRFRRCCRVRCRA